MLTTVQYDRALFVSKHSTVDFYFFDLHEM